MINSIKSIVEIIEGIEYMVTIIQGFLSLNIKLNNTCLIIIWLKFEKNKQYESWS